MQRKIIGLLIALTLVFACAFALSACGLFESGSQSQSQSVSDSGTQSAQPGGDQSTVDSAENFNSQSVTDSGTQSQSQSGAQGQSESTADSGSQSGGDSSAYEPHEHDYRFVEFVWAEDFSAQAKFVCEKDNETEYYATNVTSEVTIEPLCETEGLRTYSATYDKYSDTKTEVLSALGHDRVNHEAKSATCTEIGWEAYETCTRCGYTTYVEIPATGHNYVDDICTICGKKKETIGLTYKINNDGESYSVTGIGTSTDKELFIPEAYEGKAVTSIGDRAFSGCDSLTSVTIPDSVTNIGSGAFGGCSSLESITIPFIGAKAGVTASDTYQYPFGYIFGTSSYTGGVATEQRYYGSSTSSTMGSTYYIPSSLKSVTVTGGNVLYGAFYHCDSLTSVTIGNGVTSIGGRLFFYCSSLTSITIPDSVTSIGYDAFFGCSSLTSVFYDGDISGWCNISFSNLSANPLDDAHDLYIKEDGEYKLVTDLVIPDTVTEIKKYAFYHCDSLTSVTIPDNVTSIGGSAFSYCPIESATIPAFASSYIKNNNLKSVIITGGKIDDKAFQSFSSLTSVTIGDSVTSIGERAFEDCSSLTSITIPDGVTSIGGRAFRDCHSLTSVTIGNGVMNIDNDAFYSCYKLVEVYNKSSLNIKKGSKNNGYVGYYAKEIYTEPYTSKLSTDKDGYIIYTDGDLVSLIGYTGNETELVLPDGITEVYQYAFYRYSSLTSVTIPNSVKSIGSYVFQYSSNLVSVTIGKGVKSIGNYAFENCSVLTSITIPDSVTSIGDYAFRNCSSLTSVTIGNGVTSIGEGAFAYCRGLTSITIPDGVTSIGGYAFNNCSSLTSVTIPNSVTSIGDYAFSYCPIESATIPSIALSYIEIDNLKTVTITNGVIGNKEFENCSSLTSVTIGNGVTSIGENAFHNCGSLTSVIIGNGIVSIGKSAFYNCRSLTSVTIGIGVTSIDSYAFCACLSLASVIIPDSVTSIGARAFYNCKNITSVYYDGDIAGWCNISFVNEYANPLYYAQKLYIKEDGEYKLVNDLVIPDTVMAIKEYAFYNCTNLTSVTIPDSVTSIVKSAFYNCRRLTSVTIPDGVTSIGSSAFYGCYKLVEVYNKSSLNITKGSTDNGRVGYYAKEIYTEPFTSKLSTDKDGYIIYTDGDVISLIGYTGNETELVLPDGITEIYQYAFSSSSTLYSIIIPDSVTSIGGSAFAGCSRLTSVTIGNGVMNIDNDAFYSCYKLVEVYNKSSLNITKGSDDNGGVGYYAKEIYTEPYTSKLSIDENGYIIYTDGSDRILIGYTGNITALVLPDSITEINKYAFRYSRSLTSVTIPNSVKSIGSYAFYHCDSLTRVTIPNSVNSIGGYAFENCSSLTSVTIGNGASIGSNAFHNCYNLASVTISNGVMSIDSGAFEDCISLTSVTIPDSVMSIGFDAFYNCTNLTSVTIGNGVTWIGIYAFSWCSSLTSVNFNGTKAEWQAIEKGSDWNYNVPATVVVCKDGNVSL